MERDRVIAILRAHEPELRAAGVEHLSIFGSLARREATDTSNVDVLVRLTAEASWGGFTYFSRLDALVGRLEEILGCPVDLVTEPVRPKRLRKYRARGDACLLASGPAGSRTSWRTRIWRRRFSRDPAHRRRRPSGAQGGRRSGAGRSAAGRSGLRCDPRKGFPAGFFLPYDFAMGAFGRTGVALTFGDHRLDLARRELRSGGELVAIEPRAFDLLAFLVQHRDRVVGKDDLLQGVWGGRIVSDSALTTRINAVRRALGDDGTAQRLIRTVTGKGVRFVGKVAEIADQAPITGEKPSIAVLPFLNLSGDPEQEYFVDGMVEEIITALSRIRWLLVLARNSRLSYKGQAPDVRQVGRELGARYVLEGSVRKSDNRLRISGQLIDAVTGAHLWADRFDGSIEDVFDLQDQVASSVAGVIEPTLQAAETARSADRPTNDLTAYDLYLRAYAMVRSSSWQIPEALRLTEQAIARDPRYGLALSWAANCCYRLIFDGRSEDPAADRLKGADFARRALEVAGDDPGILVNSAVALAYFGEDIDAMLALVDRALAFNPNFARGLSVSGLLRLWRGEPDLAIEHNEAALRLSPRVRISASFAIIGEAHFVARRFDEAALNLLLAIQDDPSFPYPYRVLAACYAHMGRLDDAREILARLRAIAAVVMTDPRQLRKPEHRELLVSGLRLALGDNA
jgi:TolB-like protein/predicted nucleotidyltransferase